MYFTFIKAPLLAQFAAWNAHKPNTRWQVPLLLTFIICIFFMSSSLAQASPKYFVGQPPELSVVDGYLHLSLKLSVDDESGLRDLLRDGANVNLKVKVKLERKRTFIPNDTIYEQSYTSHFWHDPLLRVFNGRVPARGDIVVSEKLFHPLLEKTWKSMGFNLISMDKMASDETYRIIINVSLDYTDIPPWVDRTLVFWSRSIVEPVTFKLEYKVDDVYTTQ